MDLDVPRIVFLAYDPAIHKLDKPIARLNISYQSSKPRTSPSVDDEFRTKPRTDIPQKTRPLTRSLPFFRSFPRLAIRPIHVTLPKRATQTHPDSLAVAIVQSSDNMASKVVSAFLGPLTATALDEWLGQCDDGFAIHAATKAEKTPALTFMMASTWRRIINNVRT
ncbi:hypothetical protein M422DRAFT_270183 [Sphaerobolus stellatus SS14]|uniref:Uncharacterized protein n=1 Tax=Sphaerobolus stellatus (strain SS14) TaxID=990650 RepID=A0A0C9UHS8_SPHS4|nr:hypothetical protein M422DRAFT_270183 [Sphaerobolus stellatus SS14]